MNENDVCSCDKICTYIGDKEGLVTVCMFLLLEYKLYLTPLPFGF